MTAVLHCLGIWLFVMRHGWIIIISHPHHGGRDWEDEIYPNTCIYNSYEGRWYRLEDTEDAQLLG